MKTKLAVNRSGFTLVELLIVIVVIAILASISVVAYGGVQERARISSAKVDLRNFGQSVATLLIDDKPMNGTTWLAAMKAANIYDQTRDQSKKSFALCSNSSTREYAIIAFVPMYRDSEPDDSAPLQAYVQGSVREVPFEASIAGTYVSEKLCGSVLPSYTTATWTYSAWTNG